MLVLVVLCVCLFISSLVYYYLYSRQLRSQLRQRFEVWAQAEGWNFLGRRRMYVKWIVPLLKLFSPLNAILPLGGLRRLLNKRLMMAALPLTVNEFLSLKELSALATVGGYILLLGELPTPTTGIILLVIGFFLPDFFLQQHIAKRKKSISRDLPNVIDLLKLCVDAGMDFMLAVKRVVKDYKPCPLTEELADVWRQIQMGRSRTDALRHLAWKLEMQEVSSFVRALIQGDRMGTPIGEILRAQAEEMRTFRVLQAEEAAMKAPVKMLFPLLFFIMPVILIVVAGPIILKFIRGDMFSIASLK